MGKMRRSRSFKKEQENNAEQTEQPQTDAVDVAEPYVEEETEADAEESSDDENIEK